MHCGGPHEVGVNGTGKDNVADVATLSAQQRVVLAPENGIAEYRGSGLVLVHHHSTGYRSTRLRAITIFWISLVPSPMIIRGVSRKYRSTGNSFV